MKLRKIILFVALAMTELIAEATVVSTYANEKNRQVPEDYANRCGEYLDAYVDAVKEAGQVWAVPVIDLGALCGLYPLHDQYAVYFNNAETDRLHPNNKGHKRMAETLMYQLLSLPVY